MGVNGNTKQLVAVIFFKFLYSFIECQNFRRADEGKVEWVKRREEHIFLLNQIM